MLGEQLAAGDLMDALKDGVALCKYVEAPPLTPLCADMTTLRLVNMAVSPGVRYKSSNMPFVQMENISHFLRACEMPPLNLPAHDRFLTVDLYDGKDPAQVLQCIAAFSRQANAVNPSNFPYSLGGKSKSAMSPQGTGGSNGPRSPAYTTTAANRPRGTSNTAADTPSYTFNPLNKAAYTTSGRTSPTKLSLARGGLATGGPVSSWSKKNDEGNTAPAWNIHQYGYMGGASQGNLGVSFGGRRQITSQSPEVPSMAEKEKRLREKIEQEKRDAEERARRDQEQREAEEEQARLEEEQARREEERRWAEETRKAREREEDDARRWEEEQRQRKERQAAESREREAQQQRQEREAAEAREREAEQAKARSRQRTTSDARLNGQFLSQYQADQTRAPMQPASPPIHSHANTEAQRIADLERQLEELRASQRPAAPPQVSQPQAPSLPSRAQPAQPTSHQDDWDASERDYLRKEWSNAQAAASDGYTPPKPPRPPQAGSAAPAPSSRPLPDPSAYVAGSNRTDRFLISNPAPATAQRSAHTPSESRHGTTAEVDAENARRLQSQTKTKAGGWASKSLLEREMERERERQREWESAQKETEERKPDGRDGSKPGQSWDVHQYGYMGGDSQNRGGAGLGVGGARRQIIGPRPPP